MYESGFYPSGAQYDPSAPWNQEDVPSETWECNVTYVLKKDDVLVDTCSYYYEGGCLHVNYDDIKEDFELQHIPIPTLLEELKKYAQAELSKLEQNTPRYRKVKQIIDDCSGWYVEEVEVDA